MSNEVIPVEQIKYLAQVMGESGLFGKTAHQIASLALLAHAEGRALASVAMEYDIIQGKPALNSRTALARFQLAGGKMKYLESTAKVCRAEFTHEQGGTIEITWTIERAKEIGLTTKDTWKKYPDQMLRARCCAEGIRAVYPACLGALYLSEEVQDFAEPKSRVIKGKEVMQAVTDDVDENGVGTVQVSASTAILIRQVKEQLNDYEGFQGFLQSRGTLAEGQFLNTLEEEKAVKILESWPKAKSAFATWVLEQKQAEETK